METRFAALDLSPALLTVIGELGYEGMTPIQAQSMPALLAGKDLIGQSKTGSGKTAAFALPILQRLHLDERRLQALVLCPTRELCAQVAREMRTLGRRLEGLQVLVLSGGAPIRPQLDALARGVHIAVGTPGRLLDHLKRDSLPVHGITTVVLDEADRMLDMGFEEDMEAILAALPTRRQTVFFSATFPDSIEAMSRNYQERAVRVTVQDDQGVASEIRQFAVLLNREEKLDALCWLLDDLAHESALIFCNMKVTVNQVARSLHDAGVSTDCLHGDLEQFQRNQVMAMFRNHSVRVVVATDVAARGLDVEDLDLVINYDLPWPPEVYIHRSGRTGRAGNEGLAVSLVTRRETDKLRAIEERSGRTIERLPRPESFPFGGGDDHAMNLRAAMETIQISGGRKDKVRPGDILGALTGEAGGLAGSDVGKIEIHDRLAFVAVSRKVSQVALRGLNEGRIKGRKFRATLLRRYGSG
jgi:ATP-independent RNA helicase DbpA